MISNKLLVLLGIAFIVLLLSGCIDEDTTTPVTEIGVVYKIDENRIVGGTHTDWMDFIYFENGNIYAIYTGSPGVGTYTVATGSSHPSPGENVLYGGAAVSPWSTYLTVRVYDTSVEYVSTTSGPAPSTGYTVVALDTCSPSVSTVGNEVTTTWTTPENLTIQQVTAIEGTDLASSRVRVTTTVANNDATSHDVGIRYEWDLQIDGYDGSWLRERDPDGSWLDVETEWVSPTFERFETTNSPSTPVLNIFGTVTGPALLTPTPPDLLQFAAWGFSPSPGLYQYAFDFTPTGRTIAGFGLDSALAYYWGNSDANKIALSAGGGSTSVTTYLFASMDYNY